MKLTKKQQEALDSAPLYLTQSEVNLNSFCWSNGYATKDFREVTIDSLIEKGLLVYSFNRADIVERKK